MKYVWIIILILIWAIWGLASILNIIECVRDKKEVDEVTEAMWDDIEDYTASWILVTIVFLFVWSLFVYVKGK